MTFRVETYMLLDGRFLCGHVYYDLPEAFEIKTAQHALEDVCRARAQELYGASAPVSDRLTSELRHLEETDSAFHFLILKEIAELSKEERAPMLCGGSGAPFVEYLLGASPIDPLPPHYRCENCRFLEFSAEAADGFDLPPKRCPGCGRALHRDGHNCSAAIHQYNHEGRVSWPYYAVRLSDDVIRKLPRRLDSRFCETRSKRHLFRDVEYQTLPRNRLLTRLSEATGTDAAAIDLDDDAVWNAVAKEQYEICLSKRTNPEESGDALKANRRKTADPKEKAFSVFDLTRIIGFRHASCSLGADAFELRSPVFYATKDDIYDALTGAGFPADKAAILSHGIGWGRNRSLKHVPSAIVGNMYAFESMWTRRNCLVEAFGHYLLKWYEIHYPETYQTVCAELGENGS